MAREIRMPKIGMTEGDIKLVEYHKKEGDLVEEGDILFSMESDKVASEAESPGSGVVLKIYVDPGEMAPIGRLVMVIGEQGEDVSGYDSEKNSPDQITQNQIMPDPMPAPDRLDNFPPKTSPSARKLAEQNGISLVDVANALGLKRRVQREDVELYMSSQTGADVPTRDAEPEPDVGKIAVKAGEAGEASAAAAVVDEKAGESPSAIVFPVTNTRKVIAERMHSSLREMAQTSVFAEFDVTELVSFRNALLEKEPELGTRITMTDIFALATARMLKGHPRANAEWRGTEIVSYPYVHLSIAVATKYGLVSPVIKNADAMGLVELSKAIGSMVARAREKKLRPGDLSGGTFTITNMGVFPVDGFNPIVNPPQTAILGFGRIVKKPAVFQGQIVARDMMTISLTYDHRVLDGSDAGAVMKDMKLFLEHPALICCLPPGQPNT